MTTPAPVIDGTVRLRGVEREAWEAYVRIGAELGAEAIATSEREREA